MPQIALVLIPNKLTQKYLDLFAQHKPEVIPIICNSEKENRLVPSDQFLHLPIGKEQTEISKLCGKNNYQVVAIINRMNAYEILHSKLVDQYQVPGPTFESMVQLSNKDLLHLLMQDQGLTFYRPQTVVTELDQVAEVLKAVQFPVVIKPYTGSHSRGVYTLHQSEDFYAVQSFLKNHFRTEYGVVTDTADKKTILIEEFIDGKQVTPLPYVDDKGKVHIITLADVVAAGDLKQNHMQLIYRTMPSKYSEKIRQRMHYVLQKLATAVGLKSTLLHPDFMVVGKHVYLIEVNVRIGGFRSELVKHAFNLDLELVSLQLAFGDHVTDQVDADKSATACEIWHQDSGVIKEISLPKSKQMVAANIALKPGKKYVAPPKGDKRLGSFYVVDDTDSLTIAKRIRSRAKIVFQK